MPKKQIKSCLVVTYGPVPTPQYQTVEGGGMRAWGLAQGLLENGVDVTVAVNNSFPQEAHSYGGVSLVNWGLDDQFIELINSFDSVIISYCMGDPSVFVADNISDDIQLILDVYVPIYVEVSARESEDTEQEYKNYFADLARHNHVLRRGDYFLCASQTQKIFYTGVLSSLGIVNPRSYRQSRLLILPFGIHNTPAVSSENPYSPLGIDRKKDKIILWFGGMYPWFRADEFLKAVARLSLEEMSYKFVIVGGKNPFNPNPDFSRQYELAQEFAKSNDLLDKNLFFVDWVDFDERINWYRYADFVISINQPGEENIFSWRTRVMDYVWGEVVTLTNGGDPLSEDLLSKGAAIKLKGLTAEEMVSTIKSLYSKSSALPSAKKALASLKPDYYWATITAQAAKLIREGSTPFKEERAFRKSINHTEAGQAMPNTGSVYFAKARKVIRFVPKAFSYAKTKGLRQSAKLGLSTIRNQTSRRARPHHKQYIFLSNHLDNSGAPVVLLQIVQDLIDKKPSIRKQMRVLAPAATKNRQKDLRDIGVRLEKAAHGLGGPLTGLQMGLRYDDFVLLNTVAVFDNYRSYVFNLLGAGRLKHAYWFIHEDVQQTKVVAPQLYAKENIERIHKLAEEGKLTILVPSRRVKEEYDKLFRTEKVEHVDLRIDVDERYLAPKPAPAYSKLSFLLMGTAADGRKGQLIALPAFQRFLLTHQAKNPKNYRDFSVHFVGVNEDYISQQIKSVGHAILGKRLHVHPSIPKDEALEVTAACNAVICCSLNETFALYVAEGMAMGHVVLRNNSAGVDEQLKEDVNGYFVDSENINQFADVIEKLLSKGTPDKQLMQMGLESQRMAEKFLTQNYSDHISLD